MEQYARILNVPLNATDEDIHRAYRKLASAHHPDLGGDKDQFQQIQHAYEQLLVLRKRARQDRRKMDVGNAAYDRNVQHQQMHQQSQQPASQQPDQGNARQPDGTERPPAGGVGANGQPAPHQTATADKSHVGQRDTRGGSFLTRKLPLQDATTLFILINTLDIFMTYVLMRFGAIEANPFANYFFKKYNFNGMIFFKLAIVAGVCVIAQVVATKSIRKGKNLLMLGSILVGAVVIYSVMLFVTKFL